MNTNILYKHKTSSMKDKEKNSKNLSYFLLPEHTRKMDHLTILSVGFALFGTLKGKSSLLYPIYTPFTSTLFILS